MDNYSSSAKEIAYSRSAVRTLARMPRNTAGRIRDKIGATLAIPLLKPITRAACKVPIVDIEAGRATGSARTLRRLADALGIAIDDLVSN